ncbi:hypothetical protein QJU43_09920 [Pasteurella atlantica]|uniref:hypothetical protein n=1 Tax=Pasteurellaceae TaxID=712 RepID=UPI002773E90A|nr:hypothetical protein [Pasteurella atlantica]MDP8034601.1 hypothetical protein [Pasteurella atlantica]MDP8036544.1 hypothetical protein [Pasteurella atlantica]MDP8038492.1 hypothetical protein [Pasteurella atlantica]MDP8048840.1 hypothetical protein [Pasteurella atlantica]MDP8050756.1 hypothetical protein [Pasteurella atlantica]
MSNHQLSRREKYAIHRWFKKIDDNTLELKEKRLGPIKLIFLFMLSLAVYYDFIHPEYREMNIHSLQFSFMPETRFQETWYRYYGDDLENPGFSKKGESKAQFMAEMWEKHKHRVWDGYGMVAYYIFLLTMILWPNKRRIRFDRKRGIIYTYAKGKLYVTEINKLMRPLSEYIANKRLAVVLWVHPYQYTKRFRFFLEPSQMAFYDYTMWLPLFGLIFTSKKAFFKKSSTPLMQRFLVDFMNPDIEPERLASMMEAVSSRRNLLEWVMCILIGWIDGLWCKGLPKQSVLEKALADYFSDIAPTIQALPSWRSAKQKEYEKEKRFLRIISVKENKQAGFRKVPCPTLFEYPTDSLHYDGWGKIEESS